MKLHHLRPAEGSKQRRVRVGRGESGRRGKTVTVVEGLPRNRDFLKQLAGELKKTCGSGGKALHLFDAMDHRGKITASDRRNAMISEFYRREKRGVFQHQPEQERGFEKPYVDVPRDENVQAETGDEYQRVFHAHDIFNPQEGSTNAQV